MSSSSPNPVIDGISLSAFLYAIAQQESGSSYSAVNASTGALGKYQVLPSNVASWTQRALGYSLTPQQFLASPAAQEKTVQTVLGGYFRSYGPAGAASAWYSGDPKLATSTTPEPGGPSISGYVQSVLGKARNAMHLKGAGSSGGGLLSTVENAVVDTTGAAASVAWDPLGFLGDAIKKDTAVIITSVEKLSIEALLILAGVGIVVVGAYVAFKPDTDNGAAGGMSPDALIAAAPKVAEAAAVA